MTPPDTKLSRNFTFGELTRTSHGNLLETNRQEAEVVIDKLRELCVTLLEPVRAKYGAAYVDLIKRINDTK